MRKIFFVLHIKLIDIIQIIQHIISRFKLYEITEIDEKIAIIRRRRAIKKHILNKLRLKTRERKFQQSLKKFNKNIMLRK